MCTQGCQTFLWGGQGAPTYDEQGRCFCVCEDDSWSDENILGRASCIPAKTHRMYGLVGLAVCAAALCHAAYHLRRQLQFHAQQIAASTSRIEQCRRKLHTAAIIFAASNMGYFSMVLAGLLRWSVAVLAVVQIPKSVAALLLGQMWIYTLDPRLMQESPEVLAVTQWLENPRVPYVVCGVVSIAPGISAVLAAAVAATEASVRVMSAGLILVILGSMSTFLVCARSLVRVIDSSLERKMEEQAEKGVVAGPPAGDKKSITGGGDPSLSAARKKIESIMIVGMAMSSTVCFTLSLAILTKWGTAAPLPMFGIPLGPPAHVWFAKNIQLHAGRSKRPAAVVANAGKAWRQGLLSGLRSPASSRQFRSQQVVPTEETTSSAVPR